MTVFIIYTNKYTFYSIDKEYIIDSISITKGLIECDILSQNK